MRQKIKSISIAFLMLFAMTGLVACSSTATADSSQVTDESIIEQLESIESQMLASLGSLSDEDIDGYLTSSTDGFTTSAMSTWQENKEELGAFQEIKETTATYEDDIYSLHSDVAFEKADATVIMHMDATGTPTYMNIEPNYTLAELMEQAGLNTVMGVGIVFVILVLLSFIISLFKYIGKIGQKKEVTTSAQPVKSVAPVSEDNLVDDKELVAVITAAIAASENTSTDSFVVRSIRRKNNNKWQRA